MDKTRFDELLRLWQDGDAPPEQLGELEAILRDNPNLRRELVGSVLLEVGLYSKFAGSERAASAPAAPGAAPRPVRRLERIAAALAIGVSLFAVAYFLFRPPAGDHAILAGQVWVDGSSVRALADGASFEVRGETSARIRLKDGPVLTLGSGTSGALRGGRFEITRGGGSFEVRSGALRVDAPAGSVTAASALFTLRLEERVRPAALSLTVSSGTVDIEYAGLKHRHGTGAEIVYGLPVSGEPTPAAFAEKLIGEARLTLAEAIDKALELGPGAAVDAKLEDDDGQVVFALNVARGSKLREIDLDAKTGAKIEDDGESDDRSRLVAASKLTLKEAVAAALDRVPGRAVSAQSVLLYGRAQTRVEVLHENRVFEVVVDLGSGNVFCVAAGESKN